MAKELSDLLPAPVQARDETVQFWRQIRGLSVWPKGAAPFNLVENVQLPNKANIGNPYTTYPSAHPRLVTSSSTGPTMTGWMSR
jgi:hypothetical protein